ncbi:hypothetical protein QZM43_09745 [Burkholderia orbicola]|uniref:hypothetical protein n=1 Tax=Burkholderia orbicola TaxID=2978683 RepID=UPI00265299D7|nr:hypothetical protein [Burkholderia orbicola]ELW9447686.1 hypothetical protein [Burkholderia cenocepacia]MDN7467417.1 hypothetical protein [Burkholderia orbicola]MDN7503007.1 hypothetical protein [Burkholderia orbicola]
MQTIKQLITAATGYSASIGGRTMYVQSCDAGSTLTVTLTDSLGTRDTVIGVGAGVKLTPAAGFTKVEISTTADANVQFVVTNGDIDLQLTQIGTNVTNTNANPVPVAIVSEPGAPFQVSAPVGQEVNVKVQGTVNVSGATLTATNVGVNNTTANPVPVQLHVSDITVPVQVQPPASTPADAGGVAVGTSGGVLIAANASRKGLRIRNAGAGQLAITAAAGTTFANAAVVIQPGDTYIERDAPQAAWYAVSDTGTTANIQTVS